nr:hypothetical protein [uncultured Anaerosporobacter sp.]
MDKQTKKVVILKHVFMDKYNLALEINDSGDSVRYFLQSPNGIASCLIAAVIYNPDFTDEDHVNAIKNCVGEDNLSSYFKKLDALAKFATNTCFI